MDTLSSTEASTSSFFLSAGNKNEPDNIALKATCQAHYVATLSRTHVWLCTK